jgi:hypothetical protein
MQEKWKRVRDEEDIDEMVRILERSILKWMQEGIPKSRKTWRSKNWFDKEVKDKHKEMAKAGKWKSKDYGVHQQRVMQWKKKRNEYFKMIRKKKKEKWVEYLKGANSGKEM